MIKVFGAPIDDADAGTAAAEHPPLLSECREWRRRQRCCSRTTSVAIRSPWYVADAHAYNLAPAHVGMRHPLAANNEGLNLPLSGVPQTGRASTPMDLVLRRVAA
jgi:hypothetical protein